MGEPLAKITYRKLTRVKFTLEGDPWGQMRARHAARGKHSITYKHDKQKNRELSDIMQIFDQVPVLKAQEPNFEGGVTLYLSAYFRRPNSHWCTGKKAGQLRPSAPQLCGKKPDLSNIVKHIEDILTQIHVWKDDSHVIRCVAEKVWSPTPGRGFTEVVIREYEPWTNNRGAG
jgi:Holliday junction resolvase RusA-like endonuclease